MKKSEIHKIIVLSADKKWATAEDLKSKKQVFVLINECFPIEKVEASIGQEISLRCKTIIYRNNIGRYIETLTPIDTKTGTALRKSSDMDKALKDELIKLRKGLALESKVKVGEIFSPEIMKDLIKKKPKNRDEFLEIYGLGEDMYKKIGEAVIAITSKYSISPSNNYRNKDVERDFESSVFKILELTSSEKDLYIQAKSYFLEYAREKNRDPDGISNEIIVNLIKKESDIEKIKKIIAEKLG